ncbi:MAG: NrpR regulatory domain-containing protein [Methanobacterium sp. ERen5]|nr:MAG: NrpR regulatory domain-containing protein [Methanobacterium sp. ERen5]
MPQETDRKMMEILRILADREEVLGAKTIAEELKKKGYDLGERAVRYHMRILDEKGFTERIGYAGRQITNKGHKELDKGLIYDQVDFIFSKFEDMIHQTTLNPSDGTGKVIVNTSSFKYEKDIIDLLKSVFEKGVAVSNYVKFHNTPVEGEELKFDTVCGTTIDGMLLGKGIPVIPKYGGIVKVNDYVPTRFTELISYKKTSMTPLEAFTDKNMTSVLKVIENGNGTIPANFRLIPKSARASAASLFKDLEKIGIHGLLKMGKEGESVLGIPVDDNMVGIAVTGGISPLCAAKEAGYDVNIKLAENNVEFKGMENFVDSTSILKITGPEKADKVKFLLSKTWNLIYQVDFDVETHAGNVITNVSYIRKQDLDDAMDIFEEVMKVGPKFCTSKYFATVPGNEKDKVGLATVCSLTIDGILTKHGVSTTPQYGGILETNSKEPRFIELTAYNGSSLDPHEIYIAKNMTSVTEAIKGGGRVLASLREIPYVSRQDAVEVLEEVQDAGFSILKIGKPSELVYNAKVERYHVGIVAPGGLNPIAALKEHGMDVEPKAVETMMKVSDMEEF